MARSDLRSGKSRLCQFQLSLSLSLSLSRPCQLQLSFSFSFSFSLSRPCQFQLSFSFSLSLSRPCQFQLSISILGQGSRLLTYICKMKVILWTLEAVFFGSLVFTHGEWHQAKKIIFFSGRFLITEILSKMF